jgi:hypothetical protein
MSAEVPKKPPMGGGAPLKRTPPKPSAAPPAKPGKTQAQKPSSGRPVQKPVPAAARATPSAHKPATPVAAAKTDVETAENPAGKPAKTLAVEIDGVPLPDEDAVAVWRRFSEWMEEKNDLKGFAAEEGVASVKPTVKNGRPTLLVTN